MSVATMARPSTNPLRLRFGRKKFDEQPRQQAAVVIATAGEQIPPAILRRGVELSGGEPVAVVCLARIYGSAYGLPNPGLMPSRAEMADHQALVARAVSRLERSGVEAWGQIAATRRPVKTIVAVARARGARHVIVVVPETAKWRRIVEGDLVRDVSRRLPADVTVERGEP
jgi:hypothetical protein